jgi:hypothetical protein
MREHKKLSRNQKNIGKILVLSYFLKASTNYHLKHLVDLKYEVFGALSGLKARVKAWDF